MALNPAQTPDGVFYGDSATDTETELLDDDSQEQRDFTSGGVGSGYIHATNALYAPSRYTDFSVVIGTTMNNANAGTLWSYHDGASEVSISAGVVTVTWNSGAIISHTISNISASTESFAVVLAVEPNPFTTGAGDALRAELYVYNVTLSTFEKSTATMAANSSGSTRATAYGSRNAAGSNVFDGTLRICAFYRSFMTSVRGWENFVSESTSPTLAGDERLEVHVPAKSTGIGDDGQFAGPLFLLSAAQAQQSDLRLVSPLVNDWYQDMPELSIPVSDNHPFFTPPHDDASAYLLKHYLYRRPVPRTVNKARCRLFFQMYRTDGAAADTLELSVYSMNWPGPLVKGPWSQPQFEGYSVSKSYTTSHGSGATDGVWCDFDDAKLTLARDLHDYTYLCVAFKATDAGGANTPENQLFKIHALVVDPIYSLAEDGLNIGGG